MSKRLTDAECAAEYWRAKYEAVDAMLAYEKSPSSEWPDDEDFDAEEVWERFATHPHAHEEGK